jgi:hypothetical protein
MKSITKLVLLGAGVLLIASCVNIPSATRGVLVAKQACEINALAEERSAMIKSISTVNNLIPFQKETVSEQRDTILLEKLKRYSGEVEASYRFVTSSCNSLNLCMEENHYDESKCMGSRQSWSESHQRFNQLAIAIKELETHHHGHGGHGGPHKTKKATLPPSDCRAVNCKVQGAVFSTGCCYDGD